MDKEHEAVRGAELDAQMRAGEAVADIFQHGGFDAKPPGHPVGVAVEHMAAFDGERWADPVVEGYVGYAATQSETGRVGHRTGVQAQATQRAYDHRQAEQIRRADIEHRAKIIVSFW